MSAKHAALHRPLEGLEAIRFIELLPGTGSDTIVVNFVYDTLLMKPPPMFEATSYTWGDPTPTRTILCDGIEFELRQNACDFLHQLRLPDRSRMLWIDCICINQTDAVERAKQVEMMHVIYRNAMAVIAWIGLQDESSLIAMNYIAQLDITSVLRHALLDVWGAPDVQIEERPYLFDTITRTEQDQRLVSAVMRLFCRPWFRRIWIQQEMAVNQNTRVLCGSQEVDLERLIALGCLLQPRDSSGWPEPWNTSEHLPEWRSIVALREINHHRVVEFAIPTPWQDEIRQRSATESSIDYYAGHKSSVLAFGFFTDALQGSSATSRPLITKLKHGSVLEATDPRDKVYALYNLDKSFRFPPRAAPPRPKVDYSIPWQVVFIRIAKYTHSTHVDRTLSLAGRSQQYSDASLPSWVPDLRNEDIGVFFADHESSWAAGGMAYQPSVQFVSLPSCRIGSRPIPEYYFFNAKGKKKNLVAEALEIGAILQDKIVYCSPQPTLPSMHLAALLPEISSKLAADLTFINEKMPRYFTGESGSDAYAGTIMVNTTPRDELATADYERKGFAEWRAWLESSDFPNNIPEYHQAVVNTELWNKHLFVVSNHGLMCIVPAMTREGDYVAILNGCRYPVALRKVGPEDGQYYELLGPCYMHRMMRGRAWNLIEEYKSKYISTSEDEVVPLDLGSADQTDEDSGGHVGVFPFNANSDYQNIKRVLGKRRIVLV
ncbi:unnamed protein product [Cercospora beticola]|nr:unnamed protein product [Cercospora beticola]